MSGARTLAIIPAWNEEEALPAVLQSLSDTLPDVDVLVVDDGSTDATPLVAAASGAVVASLPFNLGIGAALRTGFQFARNNDYDYAFQFDADGQHDAGEVSRLLAALEDGADMAIGTRFDGASGDYSVSALRSGAMQLLRWMIRLLTGQRFTDTSSGFRAFNRPLIRHFARTYPREYMDSVEALVQAAYHGYRVVEVPVKMHERAGGVASNRRFRLVYNYLRLWCVLILTFSRPAKTRTRPE